jgi:hypothetical protein
MLQPSQVFLGWCPAATHLVHCPRLDVEQREPPATLVGAMLPLPQDQSTFADKATPAVA